MSQFSLRYILGALLVSVTLVACDGTEDVSDVTINVAIEGNGTGAVKAQTVGVNINCRVENGVVSGTCMDSFQDPDGGLIRFRGEPDAVTNFSWEGDCRQSPALCELRFEQAEDVVYDIVGRFEAKTVRVVISPKPITMTVAGEEGAVVANAQALDENGAEVFGVDFAWETSDASVVTVTPSENPREATLVALKDGSAIISATAQGITGQGQVDVSLVD